MTTHTLLVTLAGTAGVLLMFGGMQAIARPRSLWRRWFAIERRWRNARFGGGWTHLERWLNRRSYFWIPNDVELSTPDDVYAYALSDRFWRSRYAWLARALIWYSGLLLIFFGLAILGGCIPTLP